MLVHIQYESGQTSMILWLRKLLLLDAYSLDRSAAVMKNAAKEGFFLPKFMHQCKYTVQSDKE